MPIPVICPKCNSKFLSPDNLAGKLVNCPNCLEMMEIQNLDSTIINNPIIEKTKIPQRNRGLLAVSLIVLSISMISLMVVFYFWLNSNSKKQIITARESETVPSSHPTTLGDVKIKISDVFVDKVKIKTVFNDDHFTNDNHFIIHLKITNTNSIKKYEYRPPLENNKFIDTQLVTLKDNHGNAYKPLKIEGSSKVSGSIISKTALYPEQTLEDILVFEKPIENLDYLLLEVQGASFDQTGSVIIKIPRELFDPNYKKFKKMVKSAEAELNNRQYEKAFYLFQEASKIHPLDPNSDASFKQSQALLKKEDEEKILTALKQKKELKELELKKQEIEAKKIEEEELKKTSIPISTRLREYGEMIKGNDVEKCLLAAKELQKLGIQAIPAVADLSNALHHTSPVVRKEAAITLGKIGPPAMKAISELVYISVYSEQSDREIATTTINQICPSVEAKAQEYIKGLSDPKIKNRLASLIMLGKLGERADSFLNKITPYMKDLDPEIRKQTISTILEIKPGAQNVIEPLVIDEDYTVRNQALKNLVANLSKPKLLETLSNYLENRDEKIRFDITSVIQNIDTPGLSISESTKLKLSKALSDSSPNIRLGICQLMVCYDLDSIKTEKILNELTKEPLNEIALIAVDLLSKMKSLSNETIINLIGLITKTDNPVADKAAKILLAKKIQNNKLIPRLINALQNKNTQSELAQILALHGTLAIPELVQGLDHPKNEIRLGCIKALGAIGEPAFDQAYKPISKMFKTETDIEIKKEANKTLGLLRSK